MGEREGDGLVYMSTRKGEAFGLRSALSFCYA